MSAAEALAALRKWRAIQRSDLYDAAWSSVTATKTDPQTADRWRRAHLYPDT